jgi:hypothetical protein
MEMSCNKKVLKDLLGDVCMCAGGGVYARNDKANSDRWKEVIFWQEDGCLWSRQIHIRRHAFFPEGKILFLL